MTTIITLAALVLLFAALVRYARHDHFAGPSSTWHPLDDLGPVEERRHLVPRT